MVAQARIDTIEYQGRKAKRAGSEARRREILEATLRVIVADGIRAVRHRSVAREADVPLSATTYYFRDIQELIADAFALFTERARKESVEVIHSAAVEVLGKYPREQYGDNAVRKDIADELAGLLADYLVASAESRRAAIIVFQALRQAAMQDARLHSLYANYIGTVQGVLNEMCSLLQTPVAEVDATLLLSLLQYLEADAILTPAAQLPERRAYYLLALQREMSGLLGV